MFKIEVFEIISIDNKNASYENWNHEIRIFNENITFNYVIKNKLR